MLSGMVLDTNAWLDWLVFRDPSTARLERQFIAGETRCMVSPLGRIEFIEVVSRDVMDPALSKIDADLDKTRYGVVAAFDSRARMCAEPPQCGLRPTDPDDQMFIDLALHHRARWLLTRDRALLKLSKRAWREYGLAIVTPPQYALEPSTP